MHPRLRRGPWMAIVAWGVVSIGAMEAVVVAAPSRPPIEVENVRIGYASGSSNNLFKIGAWTPVWVQLRAGDERFTGSMELVVPDDNDTPTTVRQPVDLGAGQTQRYTLYARPGTIDPDFELRLIDPSRGIRTARISARSVAKQIDSCFPTDPVVLTLGNPQGVEKIPQLPGYTSASTTGSRRVVVGKIDAAGGNLPGHWQGYDAARAVVLDTNDRAVMAALNALRGQALVDWVRRGGHLIVSLGANWQSVRESPLAEILPAVPGTPKRINDLAAVESFALGSTKAISPNREPAMVTTLEEIESRGGKVLSRAIGAPLVVRGSYGFGLVTLIAFDVDQRPFSTWEDRGFFWVQAIGLRRLLSDEDLADSSLGSGRIYQENSRDLSTKLREALERFEGVKLISFGWVAFFIFLYILLIGPCDYFFLKKVVKRMELTWITFPIIVLSVSLAAYYAAYAVKGKTLRVNKVDVVDVIQGPGPENVYPASGLVRGTTFLDLFSPTNQDYTCSIVPLPLDRAEPTSADQAGPSRLPTGTELTLSWFGVPEVGFGGMGNRSQLAFSNAGYEYLPPGRAEKLEGVRVPIWSTKALTARWMAPGPAAPLIESRLRPVGPDRLEGEVINRMGTPLHDAILAFSKQVYLLGTMEPGVPIRVALSQDRQLSGHVRETLQNLLDRSEQGDRPGSRQVEREDLLLGLMFHDSLGASREQLTTSHALTDLDLTEQLLLDRPMLVARTDRAPSRLVLENTSSDSKIEQTTLLRVILPLQKNEKKP